MESSKEIQSEAEMEIEDNFAVIRIKYLYQEIAMMKQSIPLRAFSSTFWRTLAEMENVDNTAVIRTDYQCEEIPAMMKQRIPLRASSITIMRTLDGLADEDSNLTEQDTSESRDRVTTPLSPAEAMQLNNGLKKQTAEDLSQKELEKNNNVLQELLARQDRIYIAYVVQSVKFTNDTGLVRPIIAESKKEKKALVSLLGQKEMDAVETARLRKAMLELLGREEMKLDEWLGKDILLKELGREKKTAIEKAFFQLLGLNEMELVDTIIMMEGFHLQRQYLFIGPIMYTLAVYRFTCPERSTKTRKILKMKLQAKKMHETFGGKHTPNEGHQRGKTSVSVGGIATEVLGRGKYDKQSAEEFLALKRMLMCKVCLDEELCIIFLPCRHMATCERCASVLDNCPVCRSSIEDSLKINYE